MLGAGQHRPWCDAIGHAQKCGRPARSKIASVPLPEESNARGPTKSALASQGSAAEHGGPASGPGAGVPGMHRPVIAQGDECPAVRPEGQVAGGRRSTELRHGASEPGRPFRQVDAGGAPAAHHPRPRPPAAGCAPARASPGRFPPAHRGLARGPSRVRIVPGPPRDRPPRLGMGQGLRDGLGLGSPPLPGDQDEGEGRGHQQGGGQHRHAGLRRAHFQARSARPGRPGQDRLAAPGSGRRSSASAVGRGVAPPPGPSRRHFRQIVSRSRGTARLRAATAAPAPASSTWSSVSSAVAARNGGRPVSSS